MSKIPFLHLALKILGNPIDMKPSELILLVESQIQSNELVLEDMRIGDKILIQILEIVNQKSEVSLRTLRLRDNLISPKSIPFICWFLKENPSVLSLDLSVNQLGDDGVALLAKMIPPKCSLRVLNLRGNAIHAAADIIRANIPTLQVLYLERNLIFAKETVAIVSAVESNHYLEKVAVDGIYGTPENDRLVQKLEENRLVHGVQSSAKIK